MGVTGTPATLEITDTGPRSHFSVCVEEHWRNLNTGKRKERITWFKCSAFGRIAEQAHKRLTGGVWVYCEGRIRTVKKEGKDYWGMNVDSFILTQHVKKGVEPEDENQDIQLGE